MSKRFVGGVLALTVLAFAANASAGGKLTLKSLDKRVKALTALVILNDRNPAPLEKRIVTARLPAPDSHGLAEGSVYCPPDWLATGGGVDLGVGAAEASVLKSIPEFVVEGWTARVYLPGQSGYASAVVHVVCTRVEGS